MDFMTIETAYAHGIVAYVYYLKSKNLTRTSKQTTGVQKIQP